MGNKFDKIVLKSKKIEKMYEKRTEHFRFNSFIILQ